MNYLQLSQRMIAECGVSGTIDTVVGQTGSLGRCVTWVQQAWLEIQTKHDDWEFLRSSRLLGGGVNFATVSGQLYYELGTGAGQVGVLEADFGHWDMDSFRCYTTSSGINDETFLDNIPFDNWRNAYMYGAMQGVVTRPVAVAEGPQKQLCLGPASNGNYTVSGDFYRAAQTLTADSDTPTNLPTRFDMLIVYRAMQYYAAYESAPEVYDRGMKGEGDLMPKLEALYLPQIFGGGALA